MKRSKNAIPVGILLVAVILFWGIDMTHVGGEKAEFPYPSYESAFSMDQVSPLYAAEYRSGDDNKEMPISDIPAKETREYVTPLRILSVIAMSIFLVWYIRRKLKL
jgi:hypothetical protein